MDCPHCGKGFHETWGSAQLVYEPRPAEEMWQALATTCTGEKCKGITIKLIHSQLIRDGSGAQSWHPQQEFVVYPRTVFRKPTPMEVPTKIKEDYEEAWAVLPISEKASAALSRRCLQAVL